MISFLNAIERACSDYNSANELNALLTLNSAFEGLFEVEKIQLEEELFNALYDALELTEILVKSAFFEKNDYLKNTILEFKYALDTFLIPQNGSVPELIKKIYEFSEVLNGLAVAAMYLKRCRLKLTDFPPQISFELTEKGLIKLYLWSDEEGDKIADIQSLREEFELLFEKEKKTAEELLNLANDFIEKENYDFALKILNQLHKSDESSRAVCFFKKAEIFFKLTQYENAVDALLKSSVLGMNKNKISEKLKLAVLQLIQNAESYADRKKWTEFLTEYCP